MSALRLSYRGPGSPEFDLSVAGGRCETDSGFETSVIISLFTWARATPDQLRKYALKPEQNQGTWGDAIPINPGSKRGSLLWLLQRAKRTDQTLRDAESFVRDALAWMKTDGVARSVKAAARWHQNTGFLIVEVAIERADGERWVRAWEAFTATAQTPALLVAA